MNDDNELLILFATETGTAQDAADRIARECRRIHCPARVISMANYPLEELINETLVVFVVSTTGSGAEPRMMVPLWNMLLRSDLPKDLFEELQFTVFGLGDTAYDRFCWPAKKLYRRLKNLGAQQFHDMGFGDEQHRVGIDGDLDPWIEKLQSSMLEMFPLPDGVKITPTGIVPQARASLTPKPNAKVETTEWPLKDVPNYHLAEVVCNKRITAEEWNQDVRHYEFEFDSDIVYRPGDVAVIHPEAEQSDVDDFFDILGWRQVADMPLTITQTLLDQTFPEHLPPIATLRMLFTRYLDFNAIPRRTFFQFIRYFASDERECEKLDDFVSEEGADDVYEYVYLVKRTIKEVLGDFHSIRIPKQYIFDVFPPLRPREFSIASSILKHPRQVHLCVAVVNYKTKLRALRKGVCTSYMAQLKLGDRLYTGFVKGFVKMPEPSTPMICIGPGTGVAPMRSIIEERIAQQPSSTITFYFGCRSASKDQHYASEMLSYSSVPSSQLTYRVACSRDGPDGVKRTYVQDLMCEDAERIWDLIDRQKAAIVISGSSNKMPAGVKEAIVFCMNKCRGDQCTQEETKQYVERLERDGRLIEDCWS